MSYDNYHAIYELFFAYNFFLIKYKICIQYIYI